VRWHATPTRFGQRKKNEKEKSKKKMASKLLFIILLFVCLHSKCRCQTGQHAIGERATFVYVSYHGGGGASSHKNNLDAILLATGSYLERDVLAMHSLHPQPRNLRCMAHFNGTLIVNNAHSTSSRLLVSDDIGRSEVSTLWDQVLDDDRFLVHPYDVIGSAVDYEFVVFDANNNKKDVQFVRRLFVSNQNTNSVTFYDVVEQPSVPSNDGVSVVRHGLLSNASMIQGPRGLAFDVRSMRLFLASKDSDMVLWFDVSNRSSTAQVAPARFKTVKGVTSLFFDVDSNLLFASSDDNKDPAIYALDADSGHVRRKYVSTPDKNAIFNPSGVVVANGLLYAASRTTRSIHQWNATTGRYRGALIDHLPDIPECLLLGYGNYTRADVKHLHSDSPLLSQGLIIAFSVVGGLIVIAIVIALVLGIRRAQGLRLGDASLPGNRKYTPLVEQDYLASSSGSDQDDIDVM
jgi:hypothetical protein